jgi:hypothetical protein
LAQAIGKLGTVGIPLAFHPWHHVYDACQLKELHFARNDLAKLSFN